MTRTVASLKQGLSPIKATSRTGEEALRVVIYSPHFAEYSVRLGNALARTSKVSVILNRKDANRQWPISAMSLRDNLHIRIRDFSLRRRGALGIPQSILDVISFKPDLVIVHEVPDYYTGLLLFLLPRSVRRTVIIHDPIPHIEGGSETTPRLERLRPFLRKSATFAILHGPSCVAMLRRSNPDYRPPILAINHGILMCDKLGVEPKRKPGRILFFGRMMYYKGLEVLLDALDELQGSSVNFEAVIAGRGPEVTRLRDRMLAFSRITLIDTFVSPEEAAGLFRSSDVVVLPYLEATQSGVLAAAIGNGCPVIATAVGGISDVIRERVNGLLVAPRDPSGLARALSEVLTSQELLATLRAGARVTASSLLNWDRISANIEEMLLGVATGSAGT